MVESELKWTQKYTEKNLRQSRSYIRRDIISELVEIK